MALMVADTEQVHHDRASVGEIGDAAPPVRVGLLTQKTVVSPRKHLATEGHSPLG